MKLKNLIQNEIVKFWQKWRAEIALILISVVAWSWADDILSLLPLPASSGFANEHLYALFFALIAVAFFAATTKIIMYFGWRAQDEFLENKIYEIWNGLNENTKLIISLSLFALFFLSQVFIATFRS